MATLPRWQATIQDDEGNIQPLASIEVRSVATGNLAALWSNRTGTAGITNPFNADTDGFAAFHVQDGEYDITATLGGFTREWTYVVVQGQVAAGAETYREVTAAGAVTVGPTDKIVGINKSVGAATTVNIPLAADRSGVPVIIKDIKRDADVNNITPAFTGGELCDGMAGSSWVITTPGGWLILYPRTGGYYTLGNQL